MDENTAVVQQEQESHSEPPKFKDYIENKTLIVAVVLQFVIGVAIIFLIPNAWYEFSSSYDAGSGVAYFGILLAQSVLPMAIVPVFYKSKLQAYVKEIGNDTTYIKEYVKFGGYTGIIAIFIKYGISFFFPMF